MRLTGILIVIAALLAPALGFAELAQRFAVQPLLGQYVGVAALIAMGIAQLLATRMRWLELLFGGLDRIYVLHKWLGIGAIAMALLHDGLGAEVKGAGVTGVDLGPIGRLLGDDDAGEELGELALDGLLVLVGLTLLTFIPYRWWFWTHRFIGAVYVVAVVHFLLVRKPFTIGDPLGLYVGAFCAIGVLSYLYCLLPFGRAFGRYAYTVRSVRPEGGAVEVKLERKRGGFRHLPGQFAFLSFDMPGLRETHPYTISSAPAADGRELRFTIKPLGDYTRRLATSLTPGATARVAGPYGRFLRPRKAKAEVWIAGGIGITPFVAWAGSLTDGGPPIRLLYTVRGREHAAHIAELEHAAQRHPGFTFRVIDTSKEPRLTAAAVAEAAGAPLRSVRVSYCGPLAMRQELRAGLVALGLPRRNFRHEEFEIRTGIGIERLLRRLLDRSKPAATSPEAPTAARMPR
ncbi:MAG: ferric reductase-like transmembrane domain-containing protein [Hyphomicrobiaceae bacterium]|nr:ferric reductase-like transmembrane domain-containing protein [Hyphomicrobiaceae bacterium]